ncbi:MAG: hypothetical protein L0221_20065, partial [Chloroflexi bacterium]|nr:hypothetical protein [Chloroflexota bacterium]
MLLAGLRRHGAFRGGGYRNVAIGRVPDVSAFLDALRDDIAADPSLRAALARILPIVETFELDADDPEASLAAAISALAPAMAGRSFYIRLERRGLHDALHSS